MAATVVQTASGVGSSSPTTTATMPSNVTSGNLLVVCTGHPGGDDSGTAVYTDTRGLTYTLAKSAENVNGAQSNTCILTAPVTSSGAQTITRTISSTNYPVAMWAAEIGGLTAPVVVASNTGTSDNVTSVSSGAVGTLLGGNIPNMTGPSAPSGTASASENYPTTPPWQAFVASGGYNGWLDNGSALPQWLQYQFASAVTIVSYGILPWWSDNFPSRSPTAWVFAGSNNGSTWTTLDTQSSFTWAQPVPTLFAVAGASSYSYYRLTISANGGNAYTAVGGLQVYTSVPNNCLLVGAGGDSNANAFTSISPSSGTTAIVSPQGAFLAQIVPPGGYLCTFTKSGGANRSSSAVVLMSFTPTVTPLAAGSAGLAAGFGGGGQKGGSFL